MTQKRGFTLIELLVVIAIIAILMAILMPALNRVKEQGKHDVSKASLGRFVGMCPLGGSIGHADLARRISNTNSEFTAIFSKNTPLWNLQGKPSIACQPLEYWSRCCKCSLGVCSSGEQHDAVDRKPLSNERFGRINDEVCILLDPDTTLRARPAISILRASAGTVGVISLFGDFLSYCLCSAFVAISMVNSERSRQKHDTGQLRRIEKKAEKLKERTEKVQTVWRDEGLVKAKKEAKKQGLQDLVVEIEEETDRLINDICRVNGFSFTETQG